SSARCASTMRSNLSGNWLCCHSDRGLGEKAGMQLRLNPALDPAAFAQIYAAEQAVQIHGLFEEELAYELKRTLLSLPWRLICQNDARENIVLSRAEIAAMSADERRALEDGVRARAADNFGFTYFTYPMIEARLGNWDPGHPIHALTDFLNAP